MIRPTKAKAIERLRKVLSEVPQLNKLPNNSPEFEKWHRNAQVAITNTFGSESSHIKDFKNIGFSPGVFFPGMPDSAYQRAYVEGLEPAILVDRLK